MFTITTQVRKAEEKALTITSNRANHSHYYWLLSRGNIYTVSSGRKVSITDYETVWSELYMCQSPSPTQIVLVLGEPARTTTTQSATASFYYSIWLEESDCDVAGCVSVRCRNHIFSRERSPDDNDPAAPAGTDPTLLTICHPLYRYNYRLYSEQPNRAARLTETSGSRYCHFTLQGEY
jgi:hypothetical protein